MGAGKALSIVGGLLVLVSTFVLTLFYAPPASFGSGIGFILNLTDIFTNPGSYAAPGSEWIVYLLAVLFIAFLLAGIFLLAGVKNRGIGIVGALIALGISLYVILSGYAFAGGGYLGMLVSDQLVPGIYPFHFGLGGIAPFEVSIGAWVLLGGGVLGVIGGILGRD